MSELEPRQPDQFPNIITGEVVDRTDLPAVARYLTDLVEHRRELNTLMKAVEEILAEAARVQGTKTLHVGGFKAVVSGGTKIDWDLEKLAELLEVGLPYDRYNELIVIEQTFKVNANVANSIASSNPKYGEIIAAARTDVPAPERVRISGA